LVIVTRIKSTFLLPTGLASFLVFFTLFALALLFYPGFSRFFRFIILGLFGAGLIVLILTLSRGPIFGVILGFGIILFALRRQIQTFGNLFAALLILALVVGAFYVLWPVIQWRLVTPLVEQFTTGASSDLNVGRRLREIELIRQFFLDYGPLGTGIGNYAQAIYKYQVLFNDPEIPTVPHNIILYFLGEVGIFGLLGFLWLVAWLIRHARFSYPRLKLAEGSIVYYIYVASLATLAGYIPLMLTHAGLFTNEIWLGLAFFLASARVGVEMAENAYRIPEPATSEQGRQAGVEHAY
jgi:MFS family permease